MRILPRGSSAIEALHHARRSQVFDSHTASVVVRSDIVITTATTIGVCAEISALSSAPLSSAAVKSGGAN